MIPIRDHNRTRTTPVVTYALLAMNISVFVYMLTLTSGSMEEFLTRFALTPFDISRGLGLQTLITSMFLHGGFGHIIGNMLFLNIFGDNLEDTLGHVKYLGYYLLAGIGGALLQVAANPLSQVPNLGASGAIAGLMGGYLVLFPKHRIDVLVPVFGFLQEASVPAYTMLFYWVVFQIFGGLGSLGVDGGGVAYLAHIGGFVAGVVLIKLLVRKSVVL